VSENRESVRNLKARSSSNHPFEFRPSQHVSQAGLKIVCLGFVGLSGGLPSFGHHHDTLGQLVSGQPIAFLPQFYNLVCHLDQVSGSLQLVERPFDSDRHFFLERSRTAARRLPKSKTSQSMWKPNVPKFRTKNGRPS